MGADQRSAAGACGACGRHGEGQSAVCGRGSLSLSGWDALLPNLEADTVIADKAYDAEERVLQPLQQAGKSAVIPPKRNRKLQRDYDKDLYQARHLIEN